MQRWRIRRPTDPSTVSVSSRGLLPRYDRCGILCASWGHPQRNGCHTWALRPRVLRHCFEERDFDATGPPAEDPNPSADRASGGSARGTTFDLDLQLHAHLESVLVAKVDSEVAAVEGCRGICA